jgi:TonB family protein
MLQAFAVVVLAVISSVEVVGQASQDRCLQHIVIPRYPPLARTAQLQDTVAVEIEVAPDGAVASARAQSKSCEFQGCVILRSAAEENVRQWKFCPLTPEATSERIRITVTYVYKFESEARYDDPTSTVVLDLPHKVQIITTRPLVACAYPANLWKRKKWWAPWTW